MTRYQHNFVSVKIPKINILQNCWIITFYELYFHYYSVSWIELSKMTKRITSFFLSNSFDDNLVLTIFPNFLLNPGLTSASLCHHLTHLCFAKANQTKMKFFKVSTCICYCVLHLKL